LLSSIVFLRIVLYLEKMKVMFVHFKAYWNNLHWAVVSWNLWCFGPSYFVMRRYHFHLCYAAMKPFDVCLSTSVASQFLPSLGLVMCSLSFM